MDCRKQIVEALKRQAATQASLDAVVAFRRYKVVLVP